MLHALLVDNGQLFLEPQSWQGYAKLCKGNQTLKNNMARLELRPERFGDILKQIGFSNVKMSDSLIVANRQ